MYGVVRALIEGPTDEMVEAGVAYYEREFPCSCSPEYKDRGLIAPDCEHHYAADFVAGFWRLRCV
jgi:hypothetical protein